MAQTRSMTFYTTVLAVAAVTLLSGHVAPSVDDNNRYLKVTPLRGGARLAYTVFFGEIPGAAERRQLDANRASAASMRPSRLASSWRRSAAPGISPQKTV